MNAVHQVLFLIPEIRTRIQNICNRMRVRSPSGQAIHNLGDLMNAPLSHPTKPQVEVYVKSFFHWKSSIFSKSYRLGEEADANEYFLDLIKLMDVAATAVKLERDPDFETLFSFNEASYCSCNQCQSRSWKVCDPANAVNLCPRTLFKVKNAADLAISLQVLVDEAVVDGEVIEYRCSGLCQQTRKDNTKNNIFFGLAPRFFAVFLKRTAFGQQKKVFPVFAPATLTVPFAVGEISDCAARALVEKNRALDSHEAAKGAIAAASEHLLKVSSQGQDEIALAVQNSKGVLSVAQLALEESETFQIDDPQGLSALNETTSAAIRRALRKTRNALVASQPLNEARALASTASRNFKTKNHSYSLRATINHSGESTKGHYTSRIFNDGTWFECDDLTRATTIKSPNDIEKDYSLITPNTILAAFCEKMEFVENDE